MQRIQRENIKDAVNIESNPMNRPRMLVCYICGREFGTKSLPIHIKSCEKKWEIEESKKPPKQRRPCPRPPKGFQQMAEKSNLTAEDIQKYNGESFNTFVEDALIQCEYCGRRFNPKSLIPHQKACKISPMVRKPYAKNESDIPIGGSKSTAYEEAIAQNKSELNLKSCRKCGRNFNADRVEKHEKVCKGQAPKPTIAVKEPVAMKKAAQKPSMAGEKKAKWQAQHQDLQNAMKEMRKLKAYEAKGGKLSDLPPPAPSNYSHYVECRHCGRKYAPDVAERHIPKCANIVNKPGGIQASKINQKYIAGTGSKNTAALANKPATKPAIGPKLLSKKY